VSIEKLGITSWGLSQNQCPRQVPRLPTQKYPTGVAVSVHWWVVANEFVLTSVNTNIIITVELLRLYDTKKFRNKTVFITFVVKFSNYKIILQIRYKYSRTMIFNIGIVINYYNLGSHISQNCPDGFPLNIPTWVLMYTFIPNFRILQL